MAGGRNEINRLGRLGPRWESLGPHVDSQSRMMDENGMTVVRNLPTTLRHFPVQFSDPSFPPLAGSAPSTAVTGSARLIQTSTGSFAALGGPPAKRSGRAA